MIFRTTMESIACYVPSAFADLLQVQKSLQGGLNSMQRSQLLSLYKAYARTPTSMLCMIEGVMPFHIQVVLYCLCRVEPVKWDEAVFILVMDNTASRAALEWAVREYTVQVWELE